MNSSSAVRHNVVAVVLIGVVVLGPILWFDFTHPHDGSPWSLPLDHVLAVIAILAGGLALRYELKLHKGFEIQKQELNARFDAQREKLDKGFDEQRAKIEAIVESVHTRYIGDWPDHLSAITALLKDVGRGEELLIFVDPLGYASYTRKQLFDDYMEQLQRVLSEGVKVKILLYPEAGVKANLDLQFKKEQADPHLARTLAQNYQARYKHFIRKTWPKTYPNFITAVLYVQARISTPLLYPAKGNSAEIAFKKGDQPEAVYYWIVRQGDTLKNMIFAYDRFTGAGEGYGFRTADPQLMKIFYRDFDRKWKEANIIGECSELVPLAWDTVKGWPEAKEKAKSVTTSGEHGI